MRELRAATHGAGSRRPSNAPWALFDEKFRQGDYRWLLANARSAPKNGSLSFAIMALGPCDRLSQRGSEEEQARKLETAELDATLRAIRRAALKSMYSRCEGLPEREELHRLLTGLREAIPTAGDALYDAQRDVSLRLSDSAIPKAERQAKLVQYLALDDASIMGVRSALSARGATVGGQTISSALDAAAAQTAWSLIMCSRYADCAGPGSRESDEECLLYGRCEYLNRWQGVERALPPFLFSRVSEFYAGIDKNLEARNYSAFGLP
jgi:hypothetical protein